MVTKEEILTGIGNMSEWLPIYKIEEKLKMPKSTLQKFLKGERELPLKWHKPLSDYFQVKKGNLVDLNKKTTSVKDITKETPKSNYTINTTRKVPSLSEQLERKINKN